MRLEDIEQHVRDREEKERRALFDRQSATAAKSLRCGFALDLLVHPGATQWALLKGWDTRMDTLTIQSKTIKDHQNPVVNHHFPSFSYISHLNATHQGPLDKAR